MTRHKTRIIRGRYLLFFFRYVAQKQWFLWINIINSTKCRHANKKISLNETRHKYSQTSISKYMYCIYSFQCNLRIIEKRARVWLRQILYMLELPSLIVGVYCNQCINGQTTNCATLTGRQLTHQCARESRHKYIPCPSAFRTRVHGSIMTHILRSPDTYITFLMTVFCSRFMSFSDNFSFIQ